jgi:osmotically-inducible protein OsmY
MPTATIKKSKEKETEKPSIVTGQGPVGCQPLTRKQSKPILLIVGRLENVKDVISALEHLKVNIITEEAAVLALDKVDGRISAVVFVAPLPKAPLLRTVQLYRNSVQAGSLPLFVIVPEKTSPARIVKLYKNGTTALFKWPREDVIFPMLLMEMLEIHVRRKKSSEIDNAFARAIRFRLKLVGSGIGEGIRVSVRSGIVFLAGSVSYLWKKQKIKDIVSNIPGVRSVFARGLVVSPPEVPDHKITKIIRSMLRATSDIEEETISVDVKDGYVILAGNVSDRKEMSRIEKIISNIKGIRDIHNLTTIAPGQKKRARAVARSLKRGISSHFPEAEVDVKVFGMAAVLYGKVSTLKVKRQIEDIVDENNAIIRIVNKIEVHPKFGQKMS